MELTGAARKSFHQILQDLKTFFPVHINQLVHVVTCCTKAVVLEDRVRPNTVFQDDGLCTACHYMDQLVDVDWEERFEILQDLVKRFPGRPGQFHDCIIGVSGGKDSTRQA